jgi:hypothetical protein
MRVQIARSSPEPNAAVDWDDEGDDTYTPGDSDGMSSDDTTPTSSDDSGQEDEEMQQQRATPVTEDLSQGAPQDSAAQAPAALVPYDSELEYVDE